MKWSPGNEDWNVMFSNIGHEERYIFSHTHKNDRFGRNLHSLLYNRMCAGLIVTHLLFVHNLLGPRHSKCKKLTDDKEK